MVARRDEMRVLRQALDRARAGTAGAVLVAGEAGVGKSRLLDELSEIARADGARVLTGRCLDVGQAGLPYLPFVEALGQLPEEVLAEVRSRPALARLLPGAADDEPLEPPGGRGGEDMGQLQLFEAVRRVLTELSHEGCVLLALEDLHWADASTRYLLSFLVSRLRGQRLLVVATYRSDDVHRTHPLRPVLAELVRLPAVERLDLRPFGPAQTLEFVRALADETLPDDVEREIARRCEGIPFFAEELLAACAECGVPTALADVLLARIERLSPPAQRVIRLASVAGRIVCHHRLRALSDLEDAALDEALREAVTHHVLVLDASGDHYRFRHSLLREAVYADLLPGERARWHAAYAGLLAREEGVRGVAAELAHHSMESHDLTTALTASLRAATEAARGCAPAEALRHLERALKLWRRVPDAEEVTGTDEVALLRRAAYHAGVSGEPERALALARAAIDLVDERSDPELAADLRRRYAQEVLASPEGRPAHAVDMIEHAWRLVEDRPASSARAWVLAVRARVLCSLYADEVARPLAESAVLDARASGVAGAEVDALITLAVLDQCRGDVDAACERLVVARDRAAETGAWSVELRAWFNLAANRYEQGRVAEALAVLEEGVRRAESIGMVWSNYGLEVRGLLVVARYALGDWDGSVAAAELGPDSVPGIVSARVPASGLYVKVARGEFEAAGELLRQLRPLAPRDLHVASITGACGVEMALWRDRPRDAARRAVEALQNVDGLQENAAAGLRLAAMGVTAYAELARRARQRRDCAGERSAVAEGEEMMTRLRRVAERVRPRIGMLGPEGRAWIARAEAEFGRLLGRDRPEAWRPVVELFGEYNGYLQAVARWRWASALFGAGDREEGVRQLRLALDTAEELRAVPLADAVRALARRARVSLAQPGSEEPEPRQALDPLTPRERAVLDLVAQGRTNRQIGDELYISEKTVSVHLSRVMAKLGATSRAEAVALAYDRDLLVTAKAG
ncbi:regulatory protein, luxR family [Streptoalloteichus tenebrarius]|uniref:Regulatory protein, luxR family n=1 Tax=Streptoalloteichus tenebrarius (strain ATCC 17920 / DSM 40477 / JCM 4838 / CBS 697.72 / NBRC 16177 / NCIMB 11028 / NRRL B-12390 / A12253. 1 / ISP 5477) TaxID=1933 RepID=A0ABT1HQD1_STRSD|nr:regulatory protein, luxR family [Streptoalloteichus tenebrarius]